MIYLVVILVLVTVKLIFITAPFVPVHRVDLPRLVVLVKKYQIKNFIDLGCGPGRVIKRLACVYPDCNFFGVEIAFWSYLIAKLRFLFFKNVKIFFGNFFWYDWSKYDAIFLFWIDHTIKKNGKQMLKKLKIGQLLISYAFEICWLKDKLVEKDQPPGHLPIYIYKV